MNGRHPLKATGPDLTCHAFRYCGRVSDDAFYRLNRPLMGQPVDSRRPRDETSAFDGSIEFRTVQSGFRPGERSADQSVRKVNAEGMRAGHAKRRGRVTALAPTIWACPLDHWKQGQGSRVSRRTKKFGSCGERVGTQAVQAAIKKIAWNNVEILGTEGRTEPSR